jgi:hypothetical protein
VTRHASLILVPFGPTPLNFVDLATVSTYDPDN